MHPSVPDTRPFTLGNPLDGQLRTDLVIAAPEAPFVGKGRLVLDLGQTLAQRWREAGRPGVGVRAVGETQVEVVDPKLARIQGLLINPKERLQTRLTFTATDAATGGTFVVRVSQSDQQGGDLGGAESQVVATK